MNAPLAMKTCSMCCSDIPQPARKCPHCHHFQDRWSMVMYHPAFAICFAFLPLAAFLFVFASLFDAGENYETYKDQIPNYVQPVVRVVGAKDVRAKW